MRKIKSGLDYFPLDCHLDDSVRLIEAEFGLLGFALVIKLWQDIYKGEGYFKKFDKDVRLLFSKEVNVSFEELDTFLKRAFERGIFSKELFDKYEILTSKGIQERFIKCTRKRKEKELIKEYCLVFDKNDAKNEENSACFEQSKVKESKVKESKVKESKSSAPGTDEKTFFMGEYKNVCLTDAQRKALIKELGEEDLDEYIKRVDEYIAETGKEYKDVYLTIRRWYRQDKENLKRANPKRKNGFLNYEDTNKTDYKELKDEIIKRMLEE